jgi:hypothetical protein
MLGHVNARTMLRPFTSLLASLMILGAAQLPAAEPLPVRTLSGEIDGARWMALVPESWDGRLLLEAPDCFHAPAPLVATVDPEANGNRTLLAEGWALAATSYRRHGPLVADAIDDLRALREHLAAELGQPKLTLVEGVGMGGLIATFIAERHADEFHGCLAHDPQLDLRDPRALRLRCDHQPRAPLLFLASADTLGSVQEYIGLAQRSANAESVVPIFWFNGAPPLEAENTALRLESIAALQEWVRTHEPPTDRPPPPPASEDETKAGSNEAPSTGSSATTPAKVPTAPDQVTSSGAR